MSRRTSNNEQDGGAEAAPPRQRLDLWLWFARMARTRSLAASLAGSGHLRINGQRAPGAGKQVKIGDVLTIALERETRVLRIAGFAERRGPFEEARLLYEDIGAPGA